VHHGNDKTESETTIKGFDESNWNDWSYVKFKN
jgi:hypothetical protein